MVDGNGECEWSMKVMRTTLLAWFGIQGVYVWNDLYSVNGEWSTHSGQLNSSYKHYTWLVPILIKRFINHGLMRMIWNPRGYVWNNLSTVNGEWSKHSSQPNCSYKHYTWDWLIPFTRLIKHKLTAHLPI